MNMCLDPADGVQSSSRRFENFVSQILKKAIFDSVRYHRQTGFRVPGDVEVDFRVDGIRHFVKNNKKDVKNALPAYRVQSPPRAEARGYLPFG